MKKTLLTLALVIAVTFSMVGAGQVVAEEDDDAASMRTESIDGCTLVEDISYGKGYGKGDEIVIGDNSGEGAIVCLLNIIYRVTNLLFYVMMILVITMILLGGFFVLTAGANEEKVEKGKQYITYAMIGFAIAIFAYSMPWLVNAIMA